MEYLYLMFYTPSQLEDNEYCNYLFHVTLYCTNALH